MPDVQPDPSYPADLHYARPARAYYQGNECKVVQHLGGGKVRIQMIATGLTLVVRTDEVSFA